MKRGLRWPKVFFCAITSLLASSCSSTATSSELLEANFLANGQAPIDLLSPTENQQVTTANPTFNWSSRGVSLYTLEIAADAKFVTTLLSKEVVGSTYTLADSDLISGIALTTNTYYWRVKVARLTKNLQSKVGAFFLVAIPPGGSGFAGNLFVDTNASMPVQNGSRLLPYRSIQASIEAADSLRAGNAAINFEIKVAQGIYSEEVNLKPGLTLLGGYETSNWARDYMTFVSTIVGQADSGVRANAQITIGYRASTIVDGFHIKAGGSGTATHGIANFGGSPTIRNNTITGGSGSFNNYGIYVTTGAQPLIVNNTVYGGTGSNTNYGIFVIGSGSNPLIWNNTINGGLTGSGAPSAIQFRTNATGSIRNNIIFNSSVSGNCISENDNTADPSEVLNNNLFNCTTLYEDEGSNNIASLAAVITVPTGSLTSFGNVNITNSSNQLFVSLSGTDGNSATMADNDWHLKDPTGATICNVLYGGINLSTSFTSDHDGLLRTALLPPIAPCSGNVTNSGAAGWSMGAYEKQN